MKTAVALSLALASFVAGASWAFVYPYWDAYSDAAIIASVTLFFATVFVSWTGQGTARIFAATSAVAGVVATAWSDLAWRVGFWYPELPHVLHHIFRTDGEASYNASDAQLFIVVWAVVAVTALVFRRTRIASNWSQQHAD